MLLILSSISVWSIHVDVWVEERTVSVLSCIHWLFSFFDRNVSHTISVDPRQTTVSWGKILGSCCGAVLPLPSRAFSSFSSFFPPIFFFFLNSHPYCQTSSSIVLWWRVKTKTATIFFSNWFSSFKPFAAEGKQEMIGGQAYTVGICGSFSNLYFILSVKQCTRRALSTLLTPTRAAAHQMW